MRGRAPGPGLLVLACFGLIGCTELANQLPREGVVVGPPRHADGVPAHGAIAPQPAASVASPEPATPPVETVARPALTDLHELIGLERDEVQARLGDPVLRRHDAPAEIWQYRSALCVLDLFLYRDGQAVRVADAEIRPRDGQQLPAATCLSSL